MLVSRTYNPQSRTAEIVQGVANAVSAGVLIYLALVDMISEEFHKVRGKGGRTGGGGCRC
jgi:zinc transporter 1/2/3